MEPKFIHYTQPGISDFVKRMQTINNCENEIREVGKPPYWTSSSLSYINRLRAKIAYQKFMLLCELGKDPDASN